MSELEAKYQAIFEKIKTHDWHYEYSCDHRVWKNGANAEAALVVALAQIPSDDAIKIIKRHVPLEFREKISMRFAVLNNLKIKEELKNG